jgi:hypothetical protein
LGFGFFFFVLLPDTEWWHLINGELGVVEKAA